MAKGTILIIEDDPDIVQMIEYNLGQADFDCINASDGADGIEKACKHKPDLIILDIMLPVMDGFEVCKNLKADRKCSHIPIIMLSAKSQETDKVVGLELGADDYVTKPFSPRELIARIKANLRKVHRETDVKKIQRGDIVIDSDRRKVIYKNNEIELTSTEFKLLEFMARRPGIVFSRNQILDGALDADSMVFDRTVDAHIKSLRRKLGIAKDYIETVRGAGYRFREYP